MKKTPKEAFTLVELSVVIIIVGILITGIYSAMDLYDDYKNNIFKKTDNLFKSKLYFDSNNIVFHIDASDSKTYFNDSSVTKLVDNQKISAIYNIMPINLKTKNLESGINKLVNADSSSQPIYNAKELNGFPSIKFFNGSTNLFFNQSVYGYDFFDNTSDGNTFTFFIVYLFPNASSDRSGLWTWGGVYSGYYRSGDLGLGKKLSVNFAGCCYWDRVYSVDNPDIGKPQVVSIRKSGCNISFRSNGKLVNQNLSGNSCYGVGPDITNNLTLGNFEGYLGELIVFKNNLNDSDVKKIENQLMQKWHIKN